MSLAITPSPLQSARLHSAARCKTRMSAFPTTAVPLSGKGWTGIALMKGFRAYIVGSDGHVTHQRWTCVASQGRR
jgi:hypothetical protein